MPEFAFISVADKTGLSGVVETLSYAGTQIVSMGGTGEAIQTMGVPVISPEDFIDDAGIIDVARNMPRFFGSRGERIGREVIASVLAQYLCLTPESLRKEDKQPLDIAYVNLMQPKKPNPAVNIGVGKDKGGLELIDAAVEGGRLIVCEPSQITEFMGEFPFVSKDPERRTRYARKLAAQALRYESRYNYSALQMIF